jgi:hypothetical protein
VSNCIQVGGDEQAAGVLTDAQRRHLNLVVIDVTVKAHYHSANLLAKTFVIPQRQCLTWPTKNPNTQN